MHLKLAASEKSPGKCTDRDVDLIRLAGAGLQFFFWNFDQVLNIKEICKGKLGILSCCVIL